MVGKAFSLNSWTHEDVMIFVRSCHRPYPGPPPLLSMLEAEHQELTDSMCVPTLQDVWLSSSAWPINRFADEWKDFVNFMLDSPENIGFADDIASVY